MSSFLRALSCMLFALWFSAISAQQDAATPPQKTCYSVGDPHVKQFAGAMFDSHATGWKTLYKYGQLEIQLEQATWSQTGSGVTINRAVRYSTDGGKNWDETVEGGKLLAAGTDKIFTNPDVFLRVEAADYSNATWVNDKFIYNVYVTTNAYTGATGQCVQGKLRRRLEGRDGVVFPSETDAKITKQQAEEACAALKEQKQNCITDVRMANDPGLVHLIKQDFAKVEETLKTLEATPTITTPTVTITSTITTPPPAVTETSMTLTVPSGVVIMAVVLIVAVLLLALTAVVLVASCRDHW